MSLPVSGADLVLLRCGVSDVQLPPPIPAWCHALVSRQWLPFVLVTDYCVLKLPIVDPRTHAKNFICELNLYIDIGEGSFRDGL
jgi:hypothetical protein